MDNAYHALIMAGSVLLFIIGITSAVYNYNRVLEVNDKFLTNSERYARDAENFQYSDYYQTDDGLNNENLERLYSGAEIANMIFNMYTVKQIDSETGLDASAEDDQTQAHNKQIVNSDIAYSKIYINGVEYDRNSNKLAEQIATIRNITKRRKEICGRYKCISF